MAADAAKPAKSKAPAPAVKKNVRGDPVDAAARTAQLKEQLKKEQRAQEAYQRRLAEHQGQEFPPIKALTETAEARQQAEPQKQDMPELLKTIQATAREKGKDLSNSTISRTLGMSVNPGYVLREEEKVHSSTQDDYRVDTEELEYMRRHGLLDNQHHRKASEVSKYVEALVRNGISLKSANKESKPAATK